MSRRCCVFCNVLDVPRNYVIFLPSATMHILNRISAQTIPGTSQLRKLRFEDLRMVVIHIVFELLDFSLADCLRVTESGRCILVEIPAPSPIDLMRVKRTLRTYC